MKTKNFLKGAVLGVILGTIGGYLFNPKSGKQNQEKVKAVAKKLMTRLTQEVNAVKNVTKKEYTEIVKKVMSDFQEDKSLSKEAWGEVAKELESRWTQINAGIKSHLKKKTDK